MTYTPDSRLAGQFGRALRILEYATETVTLGERRMKRADLACQRAYDHAEDQSPDLHHWEGGGSTTPNEDASEKVRTKRQAVKDHDRILKLGFELDNLCREAEQIIARQTEVIHESKLPITTEGGCTSCARFGHWGELDARRPRMGKCRWCRQFELDHDQLPPRDALELRHNVSPEAAGRWVAKQPELLAAAARVKAAMLEAKFAAVTEKSCAAVWTDMAAGVERRCSRPADHIGDHIAEIDGEQVAFPGVAA